MIWITRPVCVHAPAMLGPGHLLNVSSVCGSLVSFREETDQTLILGGSGPPVSTRAIEINTDQLELGFRV